MDEVQVLFSWSSAPHAGYFTSVVANDNDGGYHNIHACRTRGYDQNNHPLPQATHRSRVPYVFVPVPAHLEVFLVGVGVRYWPFLGVPLLVAEARKAMPVTERPRVLQSRRLPARSGTSATRWFPILAGAASNGLEHLLLPLIRSSCPTHRRRLITLFCQDSIHQTFSPPVSGTVVITGVWTHRSVFRFPPLNLSNAAWLAKAVAMIPQIRIGKRPEHRVSVNVAFRLPYPKTIPRSSSLYIITSSYDLLS